MNDLQHVKLQDPSIKPRSSLAQTRKKIAIYFLAASIVSVMISWFGFLGWGVIAILHWLSDCIRNFSTTYF